MKPRQRKLEMPPHEGAEAHQRLMKELRANPERIFEASVKVGIHNRDGTLTEKYAAGKTESER